MATKHRVAITEGISEAEFQTAVLQLARVCNWREYHTFDSRRSREGFPDLVLIHRRRGLMVVAELKSAKGIVSVPQTEWLADFRAVAAFTGGRLIVRVWRPEDWSDVQLVLTGREQR